MSDENLSDVLTVIKKYVDAKVADAVREQAWLKSSWTFPGSRERDELAKAEQELLGKIEREG